VERIVTRIGLVSDTHGLVRPEALAALRGCNLVLHAGDVGSSEVLQEFGQLAPVVAVRGNTDRGAWADGLPEAEEVQVGTTWLHLLHQLDRLSIDPSAAGFDVVVHGHSHKPSVETRNGVLYVNPGSAGPRRFNLPVSVARLEIGPVRIDAEILTLECDP
jgi:uncharacterized protein